MTTIGTASITVNGPDVAIARGLAELVHASGTNSRNHGFHDDWPAPGYPIVTATGQPAADVPAELVEGHKTDLRRAIAEKLALIHEEVSEMLGEIRSGRDPLDIYFVDTKGLIGAKGAEYPHQAYGVLVNGEVAKFRFGAPRDSEELPLLKPEGFLVEAADAIIRLADLTFLVDGSDKLIEAREIKHEYNATRPYKHGRKF
ncbi:MazG-like nucleotide pyrophosphohydrolase [Arthrobacter phage AbbyDaisy]|nr:MazG-like nucleotide pyrophosphohydrolase [Arthrobacter phage AbbyDaisy]